MRYKIGDIARILDLSAETIRHYERLGIIHPEKSSQSSYRYYSAWDLLLLAACRHYRALGFSLDESAQLLENTDNQDVLAQLTHQEKQIEAEIERQCGLLRAVRYWRREVEVTQSLLNRYELETSVETLRLEYQQGDALTQDPQCLLALREWMNCIPYVYESLIIPQTQGHLSPDYTVGLCMAAAAAPFLNPTQSHFISRLPAQLCIHTALHVQVDHFHVEETFAPLFDHARKQGLRVTGNLHCRFNLTFCHGERISGLLDCFLPVE